MPPLSEVQQWFTHVEPTPEKHAAQFKTLHDSARALAVLMVETLPDNPEALTALNRLQEAVMWANTSISRSAAAAT